MLEIFEGLKKDRCGTENLTKCLEIENGKLASDHQKIIKEQQEGKSHGSCRFTEKLWWNKYTGLNLTYHSAVYQQCDAAEFLDMILHKVSTEASEVSNY